MKKTQRIDLLTTIKGSIVSFFAITMFVALGVGLFLGMHWLAGALHGMLDRNYAAGNAHDIEITFPYGLTEADLAELAALEGVDEVEAGYMSFQSFGLDGEEYVARVASLPQHIDSFIEVEGTLPARPGEIALEATTAAKLGLSMGDTISFTHDGGDAANADLDAMLDEMQAELDAMETQVNAAMSGAASTVADAEGAEDAAEEAEGSEPADDGMRYLTGDTYTVTALVKSPAFLAQQPYTYGTATLGTGAINALAWVVEDAFDAAAYRDGKPYVLVRSESLAGLSYASDAYKEGCNELLARVEELGDSLADRRYNELYSTTEGQLTRAETLLEEARTSFEERKTEAEAQLTDAHDQLDRARAAYAAGQSQLENARAQLARAQRLFDQATAKLNAIEALVAESLPEYHQIEDDYETAQEELSQETDAKSEELDAQRSAAYEAEDAEREPYLAIIDPIEAAAYDEVFAEHPELDWNYNELSDEQLEELDSYVRPKLDGTPEYVDANNALDAISEKYQAMYEEFETRSDAIYEEYSTRYTANEEEHEARLDALGEKITARLNEQGVSLPFTIDHTNLYNLAYADGLSDTSALMEQVKNTKFSYGGYNLSYNEAGAMIRKARQAIADGETRLRSAASQIAAGERKIEQGEATYQEMVTTTQARLILADEQIVEGRRQLEGLVDYVWIVLPRTYNGAALYVEAFVSVIGNVRWSMASLFLIVGILVCYSAISRLVHEQLTRIGTKKAVGFRTGEVSALFLSYTALAVAVGALMGLLVALIVIEPIILSTLNNRFVFPAKPFFALPDALLISALEFVLILGSTFVAVRSVLKMQAVELLAGEKPPSAKKRFYEDWGIWKRMGLLAQTTVNNTINDTRRVVGTLIGVAGCTALVVSALTLNGNILASFDREYEAINHYDTVVNVELGSDAAAKTSMVLRAAGMRTADIYATRLSLEQPDGQRSVITANVPMDADAYQEMFTVIPLFEGEGEGKGVWISQAYGEHFGAHVGDELSVTDSFGRHYQLPIAGFFEYHLISNQMVISPELYEEVFGTHPTTNRVLVDSAGQGTDTVVSLLEGKQGYIAATDDYATNAVDFNDFAKLSKILVAVYLVLAVLMAAFVLLNLDFMFVDEKKRELIVLMINGYSLRDAKGYIWHDSVLLTVLGIFCGLVLGGVVGHATVLSAEQANASFVHGISWPAMGAGVVGSAILATAALLISLRRIGKFDLTDINRF